MVTEVVTSLHYNIVNLLCGRESVRINLMEDYSLKALICKSHYKDNSL